MRNPVRELVVGVGPENVSEQLYYLAFTDCDIVSAFCRKRKKAVADLPGAASNSFWAPLY